jgi:hypothetical protein
MAMTTKTFTFPAFLASALINGDVSGLEESDMQWVDAAHAAVGNGRIVDVSEETHFSRYSDLPGYRLGADMAEYTALYS